MNFLKEYPNSISKSLCDEIINFYLLEESNTVDKTKANNKIIMKDFWLKKSKNFSYWNKVLEDIKNIAEICIKDYLSFNQFCNPSYYFFHDANIMHHIKNYNISPHYDSEVINLDNKEFLRHFVILLYLNDDFEGGELILPIQKLTVKPKKGSFLFLPSSFMYPHIIAPAFINDRYVLRLNYFFDKKYLDLDVYDK